MPYVIFAAPALEAAMPEQRGLLVAGEPAIGSSRPNHSAAATPTTPAHGRTSGRISPRHAEQREQLRRPSRRAARS